jgi:hypothetical protein
MKAAELLVPTDLRSPKLFTENPETGYFLRWLVGCTFCQVAGREDARLYPLPVGVSLAIAKGQVADVRAEGAEQVPF